MARPGLTSHRKFKRLARRLDATLPGMGAVIARGLLETLWDTAYEKGDDYLGDAEDVEALAGWTGEPGLLTAALDLAGGDGCPGFIERDIERPGYRVHDLFENAPDYVQKRLHREIERRQRGQTISEQRRAAGKRGREVQLAGQAAAAHGQAVDAGGQVAASGGQTADVCPASQATVRRVAANGDTPAPAPAPAPLFFSPDGEAPGRGGEVGQAGPGTEPQGAAPAQATLLPAPPATAPKAKAPRPPKPQAAEEPNPEPMPFTIGAAFTALHEASKQRFAAAFDTRYAKPVTALIRANPNIEDWRLVGEWWGAGGEAYIDALDVRHLAKPGTFSCALDHARTWESKGKGPVGRQARPAAADPKRGAGAVSDFSHIPAGTSRRVAV